jgi:multidrug resistance efflux pump
MYKNALKESEKRLKESEKKVSQLEVKLEDTREKLKKEKEKTKSLKNKLSRRDSYQLALEEELSDLKKTFDVRRKTDSYQPA